MMPSNSRVTCSGIRAWNHSLAIKSALDGSCRGAVSGLSHFMPSKKNGSIGFSPAFKPHFIQKYVLGMSNLWPQGEPVSSYKSSRDHLAWDQQNVCNLQGTAMVHISDLLSWWVLRATRFSPSSEGDRCFTFPVPQFLHFHWDFWAEPIPAHKGVGRIN